jgi:hypothetical protein
MPPLTRWFIKASLVCFILALVLGVLLAAQPLFTIPLSLTGIFPVYIHLLVFGWITQLIFGVVFWMFPKFSREHPHRSEVSGWVTFGLLNFGLLLRVIGEPLNSQEPGGPGAWLLILSALFQWLSGMVFVTNTWGRVKEK